MRKSAENKTHVPHNGIHRSICSVCRRVHSLCVERADGSHICESCIGERIKDLHFKFHVPAQAER